MKSGRLLEIGTVVELFMLSDQFILNKINANSGMRSNDPWNTSLCQRLDHPMLPIGMVEFVGVDEENGG